MRRIQRSRRRRASFLSPFSFQNLRRANSTKEAVQGSGQAFRFSFVDQTVGLAVIGDKSGGFEKRKVARNRRPGDGKTAGNLPGREGSLFEFLQDLAALEGVIRRRILLNFRADPSAVAPLLPAPLEVLTYKGFAIVGGCLIGLEQLRPKGIPRTFGLSSENMAHRIAVRYPTHDGMHDGVFIWRRETNQRVVTSLGGRLFPGVHSRADFSIDEDGDSLSVSVKTEGGLADVDFAGSQQAAWQPDSAFPTFDDAADFFRRGDCGLSCSLRAGRLDGLRLKTLQWKMSNLRSRRLYSAFFQDGERFPAQTVRFDCALLMRNIPHEWHELSDVPELVGTQAT